MKKTRDTVKLRIWRIRKREEVGVSQRGLYRVPDPKKYLSLRTKCCGCVNEAFHMIRKNVDAARTARYQAQIGLKAVTAHGDECVPRVLSQYLYLACSYSDL